MEQGRSAAWERGMISVQTESKGLDLSAIQDGNSSRYKHADDAEVSHKHFLCRVVSPDVVGFRAEGEEQFLDGRLMTKFSLRAPFDNRRDSTNT